MKTTKYKLDINNCIVIGDARRIKKGLPAIKSRRALAKYLRWSHPGFGTLNGIYSKLYRYEYDGFYKRNELMIKHVQAILLITEKELIKEF